MEPLENNTRYILELDRNSLIQKKLEFDEKYGSFLFAFLTSVETAALIAYSLMVTILVYFRRSRTKTNSVVVIWAFINFLLLLELLTRKLGLVVNHELIAGDLPFVAQMLGGLGRMYGAMLSVVWLFRKYFGNPKVKYNLLMYFFVAFPALVFFYYVYYYFAVNKYIYEAYGPSCDVISASVYLLVAFLAALCKIFIDAEQNVSQYALAISLVSLIANFPTSLMTIYIRFNLDISWTYRFHIYFVDFIISLLNCSGAFMALLIVLVHHRSLFRKEILL